MPRKGSVAGALVTRMNDAKSTDCPVEMAVVDTFTRLIFGEEGDFSQEEQAIIQALRLVDSNVAGDSLHDMGEYLRSLEVSEMIELVARVRERLAEGLPAVIKSSPAGASRPHYR